jgi:hypothetical protein
MILPGTIERDLALHLVADLLAIPTGDDYATLAMGPELHKARTLQVLSDQLFVLARQTPVFVLLEDAHWIAGN